MNESLSVCVCVRIPHGITYNGIITLLSKWRTALKAATIMIREPKTTK